MGLIEAADATVTKPCWRLYKTATGAAGEDGGRVRRSWGSAKVGCSENACRDRSTARRWGRRGYACVKKTAMLVWSGVGLYFVQ